MSAHQDGFGFIDAGREGRRPPVVGMQFLYERAMRPRNFVTRGSLLKPQDFISFIFGHRSADIGAPRVATAPAPAVPCESVRCHPST